MAIADIIQALVNQIQSQGSAGGGPSVQQPQNIFDVLKQHGSEGAGNSLAGKLFESSQPTGGTNNQSSSPPSFGALDSNFIASILNQLIGGKLFGSAGVWGGGSGSGMFGAG